MERLRVTIPGREPDHNKIRPLLKAGWEVVSERVRNGCLVIELTREKEKKNVK